MNTGMCSFYSPFARNVAEGPTEQTFIASCVERQKLSVAALENPSSCIKNFYASVSLDECQYKVHILLGNLIYGCQGDVSKVMISEADRQYNFENQWYFDTNKDSV